MVLDLAVMLKAGGISIEAAEADFEKMGLGKFAKIILAICKKWFGYGKECEYPTQKQRILSPRTEPSAM